MFKFLFGGKASPETAVPETDRERFKRLTTDLNDLIDSLPEKPRVTFDPANGHISLEEPEQFADEALALPAPVVETGSAATPEAVAKVTEGDAVASVGTPKGTAAAAPETQTPDTETAETRS